MKKQTKAERIFNQTMIDSRNHIKTWGYNGENWSRLSYGDNERVSIRTLNVMDKLAASEARKINDFERFEICDAEQIKRYRDALTMTVKTIEREREKLEAQKAFTRGEIDFDEFMSRTF